MPRLGLIFCTSFFLVFVSKAGASDCLALPSTPVLALTQSASIVGDFEIRDRLPQTEIPRSEWKSCCGQWGPCPLSFPPVKFQSTEERIPWSRLRVVEAARRYVGMPYMHAHIPAMGGLDCSNFSAWVYNYALGIRISSNVKRQAQEAGRLLVKGEPLEAGDLIFLWDEKKQEIAHVALYVNEITVIDAALGGVALRPFGGRYLRDFAWARRILE